MRKQHIVFQVNVVDEVVPELRNAGIKRPPGVARAVWRRGVIRQLNQTVELGTVVKVLSAHHGVVPVHGFNPTRQADEFGSLGPMNIVVARDDVVDQRAGVGQDR